ncbi:hypothetical protein [Acidicapsa ligni]|uniref:hypothetical protein n=1 Tax=Acidicapsa ligni TaxID=542300 RepID=UPI0021DF91E8|nr:hypothetical protein [Acidicapsa ligni]
MIASTAIFALSASCFSQGHAASSESSSLTTGSGFQPFFTPDLTEISAPFFAGAGSVRGYTPASPVSDRVRPFSRVALGANISPLGVGVQASTNLTRHVNFRASGNFFQYTANNFSAQGFNINANIHLASAGVSADYYPFHKGFRLSPGLQFYNLNRANATFLAQAGTSFSLNDHNYYSAKGAEAVRGIGFVGLGNGSPAFTMTTGWGNTIPRSGRHFSFPFEIGAAFTKTPTFSLALNGYVCDAQGQNCVNVATDPTAQADLAVQVKKYQDDVNLLRFYPIVSFGVAYSFGTRPSGWTK